MKSVVILLLAFLGSNSVMAQFGPAQIVSNSLNSAYEAFPADVNTDGLIDIVALSSVAYKVTWFQNLDGEGSFSEEITLDATPAWYVSYELADLDGDGDKDALYLINNPRKAAWKENLDGLGNLGDEHILLENQTFIVLKNKAVDVDNDGDLDIITKFTDSFDDWIVWYENLDGLGSFGDEIILLEDQTAITLPLFVDIDGDGIADMLSSNEYFLGPAKVVWYKGLGDGFFGDEQEIYQFDFFLSDSTSILLMKHVDINTDGLLDIVITTNHDDIGIFVLWLENIDGQGNYQVPENLVDIGAAQYDFYDIDNDGDSDLVGNHRWDDEVYWMENSDGLGTFIKRMITTSADFPSSAKAIDLNGDGRLDVVTSSIGDDTVAWYENTGVLGISESLQNQFKVFPNPTRGLITISTNEVISEIIVYNALGQKIISIRNSQEIDLSDRASGLYYVNILSEDGNSEVIKIIKK